MKYDDSQIGLEVDGKIWSGENYGFQSKESHDKLFIAGKLNPVQQGIDRFGNYLTTSAQADPIIGPVLNFIGAGVRTITNVTPEPIKQGVGFVLDKNQEAAENIAAATGLPVSLTDPMTIADAAMGGAVAATRPAVKTAVRETLEGAATIGRNLPPPGPQLVPVGAGATPNMQLNVSGGKANLDLAPQVMKAASTLPTPTNWQNKARQLYGEQKHRELADTFRRGQGGKLSTKNTFITADELALNKDGVLDQQLERADRMARLRTKWNKQGKEIKGDRQRELYDAASLNPNVPDIEMYTSDEARKFITKFTNVLSKDQWHHVFGNKEAGEFILSIANSDPLVAANLFKKMEVLGLNSSGVSKNIAILKEAKHTNWHNFIKDMGMEPKSPGKALSVKGSTAPGDFADLSQEMGRAIAAGKGDINDAFELIELYAKYNNWMQKQITSERFGGKIISDLPEGVGKAVQIGGYRKRPVKSKYNPLPSL